MKKFAFLYLPLIFCVAVVTSIIYVSTNNKFETERIPATEFVGYENTPEMVRVYPSYAMKWDNAPAGSKTIGWVFLILTIPAAWFISKDGHLKKGSYQNDASGKAGDNPALAILICFGPLIMSIVMFFSSYSSSLDLGSKIITRDAWEKMKDDPGQLKELF